MTHPDGEPAWPLVSRRAALTAGFSDAELRRARRSGELIVLAPGLYLSSTDPAGRAGVQWYQAAVSAAIGRLSGVPVVSHLSAAVLHGFGSAGELPRVVHVTRAAPAKSRRGRWIVAHRATLAADQVVVLAGLAVTSLARTTVDCAFVLPPQEAVSLAIAALRSGLVTPAALVGEVGRYGRVPGSRRVAQVVGTATGSVIPPR